MHSFTAPPTPAPRRSRRFDLSPQARPYRARRVREQVRDGLAVVAASAAASTGVALLATLILKLLG